MSEPLLTQKEKSTLLKAGLGLGAVVWAGPQIFGMLIGLLFLGLFAAVLFFAIAGTLLKYALIAACVIGGITLLGRLLGGPKAAPRTRNPDQRKKRLQKASLDLELAKAVRDAAAAKHAR